MVGNVRAGELKVADGETRGREGDRDSERRLFERRGDEGK